MEEEGHLLGRGLQQDGNLRTVERGLLDDGGRNMSEDFGKEGRLRQVLVLVLGIAEEYLGKAQLPTLGALLVKVTADGEI